MRKCGLILVCVLWLAAALGAQEKKAASPPQAAAAQPMQAGTVNINLPDTITKEQAEAILQELRAIRQLLEKQQQQIQQLQQALQVRPTQPAQASAPVPARPQRVTLKLEESWLALGTADAPVTIVEFMDYQCPYCKRFYQQAFRELKKNYIDTGKVRFVSRDLPLDFHQRARPAALAARCAEDQGKFWEMHGVLLENNSDLSLEALHQYAEQVGLESTGFRACLDTEQHKGRVQSDLSAANALNITGTPTFIVGKTTKDTMEGQLLVGAQPFASFDNIIKQLLAASAQGAEARQ